MSLELLGHIELPGNLKLSGFDHAALHCASGRLYVAHTANDALDVIDCVHDRYLHSIPNLTGVAGALVSDEQNLVFTSNRGENTVGIFAPDNEAGLAKVVFRCLVWVIAKLTHVWDVQIELTGSMVGYSSEVDEVFKSPSHSFC